MVCCIAVSDSSDVRAIRAIRALSGITGISGLSGMIRISGASLVTSNFLFYPSTFHKDATISGDTTIVTYLSVSAMIYFFSIRFQIVWNYRPVPTISQYRMENWYGRVFQTCNKMMSRCYVIRIAMQPDGYPADNPGYVKPILFPLTLEEVKQSKRWKNNPLPQFVVKGKTMGQNQRLSIPRS